MQVAIISDTHMPKGPRRLPQACVDRLRNADLIIHAGDLSTIAVLEELQGYGKVAAVHGNVDDREVTLALPDRLALELGGGIAVGVIHDAGPSQGRLERMQAAFPNAAAVIFGHSHIPLQETADDGFQIFNPGSPTERRRQPAHTMGMAKAAQGRIAFSLITL